MSPAGIRHVIVLVLENQSFDRMLGWVTLPDPAQRLDGVTGRESVPASPSDPGDLVPVSKISTPDAYVTDPSPGHSLDDATLQIFGQRRVPDPPVPTNSGFVLSYSEQPARGGRPVGPVVGRTIMQCLDPDLVPVISALAQNFVVCDRWFSSVPGPTWPNRFFLHAATANGLLDTPETPGQLASKFFSSPYRMRSIFENLMDAGHSWKVYFDDYAQTFALRNLHPHVDRFVRFEEFARDVASGALPEYSFIEPRGFSAPGWPANDQHPPHSVLEGETAHRQHLRHAPGRGRRLAREPVRAPLRRARWVLRSRQPPAALVPDATSGHAQFAFDRLGVCASPRSSSHRGWARGSPITRPTITPRCPRRSRRCSGFRDSSPPATPRRPPSSATSWPSRGP